MAPSSAWYCLRSQIKHENVAAAHLRLLPDVEVFSPRIRYEKLTLRGKIWVTEALFPNYLFAKFEANASQVRVRYSTGVSGLVKFGGKNAVVPDETVEQLRADFGEAELRTIQTAVEPGETVQIGEGAFVGLQAVITQVLPGRQRVRVLMEFLGRATEVEYPVRSVVREKSRILHGS
jgi:transcriptional antiterminator RfaH